MTGLMAEIAPERSALPVDTDNASLVPLLTVFGAAFALGAPVRPAALFAGRTVRAVPLDGRLNFLANPCEQAPELAATVRDGAEHFDGRQPDRGQDVSPEVLTAAGATFELLRKLAAERVELPLEMLTENTHPLDDLHLSSITVAQLVNEVTKVLGRPAMAATTNFATVRLGELAELIDQLAEDVSGAEPTTGEVPGVEPWVRAFAVEHVDAPAQPADPAHAAQRAQWTVFGPPDHPLSTPLAEGLARAGIGAGVLLCLPADCGHDEVGLMLEAGQAVLAAPAGTRFVVVNHGLGAAGLAKTVRLEDPSTPVTLVELPAPRISDPELVERDVRRVVREAAATVGFTEVRYLADGRRQVPVLRGLLVCTEAVRSPLTGTDVLLVTGGGKGITAECALALAKDSGVRLGLVGRADPEEDAELAANLSRMDSAGVEFSYLRADVTSAEQVAAAVAGIEARLGPVTAVLHGAGRNEPAALSGLTGRAFRDTLAPKVDGLRAVLAAVDPDRLKLLVTFGSIIGRAGLRGEAHYATANDWMSELTRRFGEQHPQVRVVALEWSVWSGAGMGERLGVLEGLKRDGITPISTEDGIAMLRRMLSEPSAGSVVLVSGRAAGLDTLPLPTAELPLARFLDRVVVHYPGIELITEADLSVGTDPYLADHHLDGELLFPAVLGMEAMTQVATALTGQAGPPLPEDVDFLRPVVVPPGGSTTMRLAALARDAETVDVVLRSSETGFGADHFRARLRFPRPALLTEASVSEVDLLSVPVNPATELYGTVLFQGKRFQRLMGYHRAAARHVVAEVAVGRQEGWFASFLPEQQWLADSGTRDVMMHAIQCCVPDATLLPQRIERLYLAEPAAQEVAYLVLDAVERSQDGDTYIYDLDVRDPAGTVVERWEGLSLRAVRSRHGAGPWTPTMLGPHLERSLERVLGGRRSVVVEPDPAGGAHSTAQRRAQTQLAASRAAWAKLPVRYRPDGKPEADGVQLSSSHGVGCTLVVVGSGAVACDVEAVMPRSAEDWAGLLGTELLSVRDALAVETGESSDVAGTRVWCALECVRKTGVLTQAMALDKVEADGWVRLSAGSNVIATWVTTVDCQPQPVVFAVLTREEV